MRRSKKGRKCGSLCVGEKRREGQNKGKKSPEIFSLNNFSNTSTPLIQRPHFEPIFPNIFNQQYWCLHFVFNWIIFDAFFHVLSLFALFLHAEINKQPHIVCSISPLPHPCLFASALSLFRSACLQSSVCPDNISHRHQCMAFRLSTKVQLKHSVGARRAHFTNRDVCPIQFLPLDMLFFVPRHSIVDPWHPVDRSNKFSPLYTAGPLDVSQLNGHSECNQWHHAQCPATISWSI